MSSPVALKCLRRFVWMRKAFMYLFLWVMVAGSSIQSKEKSLNELADTSSPRATMESFLSTANRTYKLITESARDHEPTPWKEINLSAAEMLRCLDLSQVPEYQRDVTGMEAAVVLKEIFDRIPLPPMKEIPGAEQIASQGDQAKLNSWQVPSTHIKIVLITEGDRAGEYLFSSDTVSKYNEYFRLYEDIPYKKNATENFDAWYLTLPGELVAPLVSLLPEWCRDHTIQYQAVWQWIALMVSFLMAVGLMVLFYVLGRKQTLATKSKSVFRYMLTLLFPLMALAVPILFESFVKNEIRIAGTPLTAITFSAHMAFLIAIMVLVVAISSRIAEVVISHPKINPRGLDAQLTRIVCRVSGLVIAIIVFLEGGKYLGLPITALLASAGVGGLALALAAQDSLRNFFGTVMIILDKPYRIGDRIQVKGYDGFVQDIGLRSTRLRLLTGHEASIPNEEMAKSDIENIGRRPFIRRLTDLPLVLDTPAEKVEKAVERVREILADHKGMKADLPPRVYFTEIKNESLMIRFIYWFHPPEMWEFLEFSQEVNLRIQRAFDEEGIVMGAPLKHMELTNDGVQH